MSDIKLLMSCHGFLYVNGYYINYLSSSQLPVAVIVDYFRFNILANTTSSI